MDELSVIYNNVVKANCNQNTKLDNRCQYWFSVILTVTSEDTRAQIQDFTNGRQSSNFKEMNCARVIVIRDKKRVVIPEFTLS